MANNDTDIKVKLGMDYDPSGATQAEQDLRRVAEATTATNPQGGNAEAMEATAAAAEEAAAAMDEMATAAEGVAAATDNAAAKAETAANALNDTASAGKEAAAATVAVNAKAEQAARLLEQAAAAAKKEAQERAALQSTMRLEAMSRRQLEAEMRRLTAARKEAAAAQDAEKYKQLKAEVDRAKQAMEGLTTAENVSTIAALNKAQAGMQVAQTLKGLAEGARNGTASLGDLANGIVAVSMALKAGLGPIGWLMIALQGLDMLVQKYMSDSAEATQRSIKETEEATKRLQEYYALLSQLGKEERRTTLEFSAGAVRDAFEVAATRASEGMAAMQAANSNAEAACRSQMDAMQASRDLALARIEAEAQAGDLTRKQADERKAQVEAETARRMDALEAESRARKLKAAEDAAEWEKQTAHAMRRAMDEHHAKWQPLMAYALPTEAEIAHIKSKLAELDEDDPEYEKYKKLQDKNTQMALQLRRVLEGMGISVEGGLDAVLEWVRQLQEQVKEQEKATQAQERKAEAARQSADAAEKVAQQDAQNAELAKKTRDANAKAEANARQLAEVERQWVEVQRGSLAEQRQWLEQQLAAMKEGSENWKQVNEHLRGVKAQQVSESLSELGETYKVTGNYAVKDKRTQQQIYDADRKALLARQAHLRSLLATPDIDAATTKQINRALKETDKQLAGLTQTMAQSTANARQWLRQLQPPRLESKKKGLQKHLDRLAEGYRKAAARAAKAAAAGDTRGLERASRSMDNYARSMGRLAKKPAVVERMHDDARRQLRAAGKSEAETAKAGKETARAAKRRADATKKAAAAIKEERSGTARAAANTQAEVQRLQTQLAELTQQLNALDASIQALASLAGQAVAAATSAVNACTAARNNLQKQIDGLRNAIDRLRRS